VTDLPSDQWRAAIREVRPDIIYAGLNWQAVPFVLEVMKAVQADGGPPVVWHFKEGPFICLEKGMWAEFVEIHQRADALIFCNEETVAWTKGAIPGVVETRPLFLLDGDLPKREWLAGSPAPRLSDREAGFHTVVPGRPIGLHPHNVVELAEQDIHLHFYGDFTQGQWKAWIEKTNRMAPGYLHLHRNVPQSGWLEEFSQYDAGWLHWLPSSNGGDVRRANWDDLNYPARITTLVTAGLPSLQYDNEGAVVATQSQARRHDIGLFFRSMAGLREQLSDRAEMERLRANVWRQRHLFTFDHYAPALVDFFRQIIAEHTSDNIRSRSLSR
jgi:hypothetical protein